MKKWLNWVALVVVFSVACGFLANWQLDRRETKLASIGLITANYNQAPVPISDLVGSNSFNSKANLWRSVSMTGKYLVKSELLVRNRPNNGQPGFEQLVPFRSDLGLTFFVSRGWLPTGQKQDSPDRVPIPTSGSVTITARILAESKSWTEVLQPARLPLSMLTWPRKFLVSNPRLVFIFVLSTRTVRNQPA